MGWTPLTLAPGQPADLVILDLETERPVKPETFKSKAKFSPWAEQILKGWPVLSFVRGKLAFRSTFA